MPPKKRSTSTPPSRQVVRTGSQLSRPRSKSLDSVLPDAPAAVTDLAIGTLTKRELVKQAKVRRLPTGSGSAAEFDVAVSAGNWRGRFGVTRARIGPVQTVDDGRTLTFLMGQWPEFDYGDAEHSDAQELRKRLKASTDPADVTLAANLANVLEQSDRQSIIRMALGDLAGQRVLGVVADQRLEAVCVWKLLTGVSGKNSEQDANHWHPEWKRAMYVPELTSAPWNVGWPTEEHGVAGSGMALIEAMKAKARAEDCDGIGLVGLVNNLDFYRKAGFRNKSADNAITFIMDLRE